MDLKGVQPSKSAGGHDDSGTKDADSSLISSFEELVCNLTSDLRPAGLRMKPSVSICNFAKTDLYLIYVNAMNPPYMIALISDSRAALWIAKETTSKISMHITRAAGNAGGIKETTPMIARILVLRPQEI
jgi:hypothetical protein